MPDIRRILCATDFSGASKHAYEYAVDLAAKLGAAVSVIHAYQIPAYTLPDGMVEVPVEVETSVRERLNEQLREFSRSIDTKGVSVDVHLLDGVPYQGAVITALALDLTASSPQFTPLWTVPANDLTCEPCNPFWLPPGDAVGVLLPEGIQSLALDSGARGPVLPVRGYPIGGADAWSPDGRGVMIDASHQVDGGLWLPAMALVDAETGEVRDIHEEKVRTQYESGQGTVNWRYLPRSNEFIWYSEKDDWGHLYLYGLDGKLKNQITKGDFAVTQLVEVDEQNRRLYFNAGGREAGRVVRAAGRVALAAPGASDASRDGFCTTLVRVSAETLSVTGQCCESEAVVQQHPQIPVSTP